MQKGGTLKPIKQTSSKGITSFLPSQNTMPSKGIKKLPKRNMILNKDFAQVKINITEKTQIIPDENVNFKKPITKNEIIYNPIKDEEEIKPNYSNNKSIVSGSNYDNIIPEIGVRVKSDEHFETKNGGLNFKNQFGRMSMKEYEMLREQYMVKGNEKSNNNQKNNIENDNVQNYNINKNEINNSNNNFINTNITNNNANYKIYNNPNSFNRKSFQGNITNDKISNYNWNIIEDDNYNNYSKNGKVMNENLFKHRTSKDIRREKKSATYNTGYVNNFNNQIISNQDWGNINTTNNPQRSYLNSTTKKVGETNLRTRKK